MAVTQEEKDLLQCGNDYESLVDNPGWKRILAVLQSWEVSACQDVLAAVDLPDSEISKRVARWQERQSLRRALLEATKQAIDTKREWLLSLQYDPRRQFIAEELYGNDPDTEPSGNDPRTTIIP